MTFLPITADASKVTGLAFMDSLGLSSPERRAQRAEEGAKLTADKHAKDRADILRMRENIIELVSPETAARMREEWALQDRVRNELVFTIEMQRKVA